MSYDVCLRTKFTSSRKQSTRHLRVTSILFDKVIGGCRNSSIVPGSSNRVSDNV